MSEDCGVSTPQVVRSLSYSRFDAQANTETREHASTQKRQNGRKALQRGNSCGLANFEKRSDTWVGNLPCDGRFLPRGGGAQGRTCLVTVDRLWTTDDE